MAEATWVLLVLFGVGTMYLMRHVSSKLEPWLERLAAMMFMGAGLVGITGWVGTQIDAASNWAIRNLDNMAAAAIGTTVAWIAVAFLGVAWVGAFLPRKWIGWNYPDWLVISGLFLPGLLFMVPGVLGQLLETAARLAGNGAIALAGLVFGVQA